MSKEPIAIIGMSGRFAKSDSLVELWKHLSEGAELIEEAQRWNLSEYRLRDAAFCDRGGFVEDIDKFDASFFNINGLEARYMDPQQRLFMEESWKALEDAGYAGARIQGRSCGVYVGCLGGGGDYSQLFDEGAPPQAFWGSSAGSVIPARIAYYLDLKGPAIAVDTACSSSLVAVHLACQGLWAGETEMALAGAYSSSPPHGITTGPTRRECSRGPDTAIRSTSGRTGSFRAKGSGCSC
ncbi:polyketide synthase [Paenibacillus sp. P26]|nr:polyketide synthase [Paenibacillus sp. P26]